MKELFKGVLYVFLVASAPLFAQDYLPRSTTEQIVKHENFVISYSEAHE